MTGLSWYSSLMADSGESTANVSVKSCELRTFSGEGINTEVLLVTLECFGFERV
jgi:hypothetical protein